MAYGEPRTDRVMNPTNYLVGFRLPQDEVGNSSLTVQPIWFATPESAQVEQEAAANVWFQRIVDLLATLGLPISGEKTYTTFEHIIVSDPNPEE